MAVEGVVAQSVDADVDVRTAAAMLGAAQQCERALLHAEEAAQAVSKAGEPLAHTAAVANTDVAAFLVQKAAAKLAAAMMVDRASRAARCAPPHECRANEAAE